VTPGQVMVASTVGKLSALLAADLSDEQAQQRMAAEGKEISVDIIHLAAQQLTEGGGDKSFHVAAAFSQLLGCEVNDIDADFFALGGHSLLAMRLARIASSEWPPRAKKSASISFTSQPSS
jgi:hypothetical protein